jgi:uncharacterized protein (DUF427 family)
VESVWDYPRPPRVEACRRRVRVEVANYLDVVVGADRRPHGAWSYPAPLDGYVAITDHFAFYAGRVDGAWLDDELVMPQEGGVYGGWITRDLAGPFKGPPETLGW